MAAVKTLVRGKLQAAAAKHELLLREVEENKAELIFLALQPQPILPPPRHPVHRPTDALRNRRPRPRGYGA